ncbi:hypothetical protein QTP86_010819 [Hemibagrus guttatus]|nr:hypothetical protein QTP86_010819 [Hemibagrus guttatus]
MRQIGLLGLQCNCSTVGSVGPDSCDPLTGGCKCLHGYSGLRCEQCYSGYFRNHTEHWQLFQQPDSLEQANAPYKAVAKTVVPCYMF